MDDVVKDESLSDVAIDCGQSGVRFLLLPTGSGPGVDPLMECDADDLDSAIEQVLVLQPQGVNRVAIGATGLWGNAAELDIRPLLRLHPRLVWVADDGLTAHLGALRGAEGVVVALGTGIVVTTINDRHHVNRVGGHGLTLDDRGSGAWIGRRAAQAAIDTIENLTDADQILSLCEERLGSHESWPRRLQHDAPRMFAALCRPLAELARAGDHHATAIFDTAGEEIGRRIRAALLSADTPAWGAVAQVAFNGGVSNALDLMIPGIMRGVGDVAIEIVAAKGSPLDGAAKLLEVADKLHTSPLFCRYLSAEGDLNHRSNERRQAQAEKR